MLKLLIGDFSKADIIPFLKQVGFVLGAIAFVNIIEKL